MDSQRVLRIALNRAMKGSIKKFLIVWLAFFSFSMMASKGEIYPATLIIGIIVGFLVALVFHERKLKEMKMEVASYARILLEGAISEEEKSSWEYRIGKDTMNHLEENKIHLLQREIDHFLTWKPF